MNLSTNEGLNIEILDGDVTPLDGSLGTTGWRTLPFYVLVCHENTSGRVQIPGSEYVVPDRHCYLLFRDIPHNLTCTKGINPVSIWCHFTIELWRSIDYLSLFEIPEKFPLSLSNDIRETCRELVTLDKSSSALEILRKQKLEIELLSLVISGCREREDSGRKLSAVNRLSPALEYMHRHSGADYNPDRVAATMNLSPSRFAAVFKNIMGEPLGIYRRKLRLAKAYEMLYSGEMVPKEVAVELGFCDEFHFAKSFKKHYGITPAALTRKIETFGRW